MCSSDLGLSLSLPVLGLSLSLPVLGLRRGNVTSLHLITSLLPSLSLSLSLTLSLSLPLHSVVISGMCSGGVCD